MNYNYKPDKLCYCVTTEKDVIDYLNDYFEMFENVLNNMSDVNLRLPLFIAEKFKRLLELWDENRILEKSIDTEVFENIYILMSNTFNDGSDDRISVHSTDDFFLECKHCGEEIQLRNNDCRYSYEFHKISVEHVEFLQYLAIKEDYASDAEEQLTPRTETDSGFENSVDPDSKAIFIEEFDKECIVLEEGSIRCNLCFCKLSSKTDLLSHVNSSVHREVVERYKSNVQYIARNSDDTLRCVLCDSWNSRVSSFVEHCSKIDHWVKSNQLAIIDEFTSDLFPPEKDSLIDISEWKFRCPVCHVFIYGIDELFEHFNSIVHANSE